MQRIAARVAVATGVAVIATTVAVPAVVVGLGFTNAGIAAGSWAAGFMSSYGGMVGAGSACAVMQSIGATGTFVGAGLTAISGAVITATGVLLAGFDALLGQEEKKKEEAEQKAPA